MKYGIIGRTAEGTELCDGQTIKTRVLAEEIKHAYPDSTIIVADTYNYKKRALHLISRIIKILKECDIVFILLSRNGMRVIFPLVNSLNTLFHRSIFHDCIGGALDELVKHNPKLIVELNKFSVNWVESRQLKLRLEELGVKNVEYLPNFKRLNSVSIDELKPFSGNIFKFCTFSRVNEAKGIGRAAQAIIHLNKQSGHQVAALDIYGPIEDHYDEILNQYINESNGAVVYKGVIPSDKSVEVLKEYYVLLFPTTFYGEGFPGTVIDAFSSGLPIIATDWHLNGEIIQDGYTGLLYDPEQPEKLKELMEKLMDDPALVFEMRKNCLAEAKKYSPDKVMDVINAKINAICNDKA